jgi:hypothetical protein
VSFKSRQNQQQQQQHEGSRVNNSGASLEWIFYFLFIGGFVGYPRSPLMFENSPRFWSGYHRTNSLGWWWFCTVLRGMATLPRKLLRLPAPLLRSLYTLMSNSPPPAGSRTANSNCNKNANTHNNKNTHTYIHMTSSSAASEEQQNPILLQMGADLTRPRRTQFQFHRQSSWPKKKFTRVLEALS